MTTLEVSEIKRITERSMLVVIDGSEHWIPTMYIDAVEEYVPGDVDVEISVPDWLARDRGLGG